MARRVKTPTLLQMEAVECGAAALGIVLGYYKRWEPLESLREACGVSRDGSKAANLLKAARNYGFEAEGLRVEPQDLKDIPPPFIVFWDMNHFLVVEGVGRDKIWLNDPASGPRTVSHEVFDKSFSGIVLTMTPGDEFKPGGERGSVMKGLGRRLATSKVAFTFLLLISLGLVIPGLLVPTFSRLFVDYYLIERFDDWLQPLLIGMVAAAFLHGGLTWMQQHYLLRFESKLALAAAGQFIAHIVRLPMTFFSQRFGGELVNRSMLNDRLAQLLAGQLGTAALNIITMIFFALVMLQYDAILTLVGVLFALFNLWALAAVSRLLSDRNQGLLAENGKLSGYAMQGLQMMETFKAGGTESVLFSRITGQHANVLNTQRDLSLWTALLGAVPVTLNALAVAAILVVGGLRVMQGELSIGMLVAFQTLMMSFLAPVSQLVTLGAAFQDAQGAIARVDDVLNHPVSPEFVQQEKPEEETGHKNQQQLTGKVELKDVAFGYNPLDPPLIEDFNLVVEPGQRIALVGSSGSGKSTTARLISGLYRPWQGEVLLDDTPIDDVPRDLLRNSVAVVDQDIVLFEGTIRNNLSMWDSTLPEERLVEAARDADIHDIIAARSGGYDGKILENGRDLSGGQRARMELARALALNPSILLLDEATGPLDAVSEGVVMDNLRRRGCTVIMIAHRLSTIRDADHIIVLEQGKMVQQGTHQELMAMGGHYRELVQG